MQIFIALFLALNALICFGLNNQCLCAVDDACKINSARETSDATTGNAKRISLSISQTGNRADCCEVCFQQSDAANGEPLAIECAEEHCEKLLVYCQELRKYGHDDRARQYLRGPPQTVLSGKDACVLHQTFLI